MNLSTALIIMLTIVLVASIVIGLIVVKIVKNALGEDGNIIIGSTIIIDGDEEND